MRGDTTGGAHEHVLPRLVDELQREGLLQYHLTGRDGWQPSEHMLPNPNPDPEPNPNPNPNHRPSPSPSPSPDPDPSPSPDPDPSPIPDPNPNPSPNPNPNQARTCSHNTRTGSSTAVVQLAAHTWGWRACAMVRRCGASTSRSAIVE